MATQTVGLDTEVVERIEAIKPKYLSLSGFITLYLDIIESGQVAGLTLPPLQSPHLQHSLNNNQIDRRVEGLDAWPLPSSHEGRREERKITTKKRTPYKFEVPETLDFCKADLETYWNEAKTGKKTAYAAKFLFEQLLKIKNAYGQSTVLEQIELATAKGFESITMNQYEKFGLPSATPKQEPEPLHPAYKVFKAPDPSEGPTTNEILKDLI
tara:strand:+ start:1036 stop:1671 length:636 start_codon:yes stop_codon:yes gene_type:complete